MDVCDQWIAVVDDAQLQIVEQYWKDRQRQVSHVRPTPSRISKAILERAKPKLLKEFGEKLALAFGDDVAHLLLGMKPDRGDEDEKGTNTVGTPSGDQEMLIVSEPVAAVEQADSPYAAHAPVSPPAPISRRTSGLSRANGEAASTADEKSPHSGAGGRPE